MYKLADGSLSTDYKVGDEFEVVGLHSRFKVGDIVTLTDDDDSDCPLFDGCNPVRWNRLKPHRKQFTKADLKDGMVVTYRMGENRLVFDGSLYEVNLVTHSHSTQLNVLDDNLNHKVSGFDIVEVSYMGETLWEREEETAEQKEIKRLRGVIEDAQKALSKLEE